jgi:AraC-like DNA-binding protein
MGLAVWRQQARLMEALSRLASGQSITAVALDVGYESPSAFTAMFHRNFGVPRASTNCARRSRTRTRMTIA